MQNKTPTFDLIAYLHRQKSFSEQTFGPGHRTAQLIEHLQKELKEVEATPLDLDEWLDVALLALDGAWRAGFAPEDIAHALEAKHALNETKNWPDWRTAANGTTREKPHR